MYIYICTIRIQLCHDFSYRVNKPLCFLEKKAQIKTILESQTRIEYS